MDIDHEGQSTIRLASNSRNIDGEWKCDVCSAVFQRLDHFKRHSNTHKTHRPFMCGFCGALYKRGDVLRRHWKTCSTRIQTGMAIPEPRLGGKEKHACDGCAKLKRSCDGGQPCSECYSRGRACSYQRLINTVPEPPRLGEWADVVQSYEPLSQVENYNALYSQFEPRRPTWDLGPQNFYASRDACYQAYGRLS